MAGPLEDGQAAYQKGDYAAALSHWRPLADQGNADAQAALGKMYAGPRRGAGLRAGRRVVPQGRRPGERRRAEQPRHDVRQGPRRAAGRRAGLAWYRKAADQGFADAQFSLGWMYGKGHGVPQDYAQAAHVVPQGRRPGLRRAQAASAGCTPRAKACRRTTRRPRVVPQGRRPGERRRAGRPRHGCTQWPRRGAGLRAGPRWYRKAADQGNAIAQADLGVDVRQRPGRAAGLRPGRRVVPQGRRAGVRRRAGLPRRDVRQWAKACRRTTHRPSSGSARPPTRGTPMRRAPSADVSPTARECRRTMSALICGSTWRRRAQTMPRAKWRSKCAMTCAKGRSKSAMTLPPR